MPTPTDIGTLIIQTPNIRGGRPHVAGTGVTVRRIIGWYKLGLSPEEIASELPHLSLAQILLISDPLAFAHSYWLSNPRSLRLAIRY